MGCAPGRARGPQRALPPALGPTCRPACGPSGRKVSLLPRISTFCVQSAAVGDQFRRRGCAWGTVEHAPPNPAPSRPRSRAVLGARCNQRRSKRGPPSRPCAEPPVSRNTSTGAGDSRARVRHGTCSASFAGPVCRLLIETRAGRTLQPPNCGSAVGLPAPHMVRHHRTASRRAARARRSRRGRRRPPQRCANAGSPFWVSRE